MYYLSNFHSYYSINIIKNKSIIRKIKDNYKTILPGINGLTASIDSTVLYS